MRRKVFAVMAVSFLMVAAAAPMAAQVSRMTASIPFEFVVAGKTMPAGDYEIWRTPVSSMIVLRSIVLRTSALSLATGEAIESRDPGADTKLVFNRYKDHYFLHEVVNGFGSVAYTLPESRAEHEMAKVATLQPTEVLAVLARR